MGTSGLALCWRIAHQHYGAPSWLGELISIIALAMFAVLAVAYLGKWALYPDAVKHEFNHPVSGNFFGTITISLLLLSAVLDPYSKDLSQGLWTLGVVTTLALGVVVVRRLLNGEAGPMASLPAWLIPGVASLDIAVAGANMPMEWAPEVNLFAVAIGTTLALLFLSFIVQRLIQHEPLALGMRPSLMILIAPFEVGFLGYINLMGEIDRFAALLFYFGLFMFIVLLPKVFCREVIRMPFVPAWWAISFPLAALCLAALKYAELRALLPLQVIAGSLLIFLSVAIAVLMVQTFRILISGKLLLG
ncbi:C4-dicarboxylate ABC transporter [Iodobacter ciconiae]|uniref:C4-dicarboxylate ABC transporter n=2 Tax=Iodobacter ciconiae TaxID=2496266 RepID=A0A3S8ZX33_9NEIS|nr:C4-dicarboxylate ABC transporter [Iodobacter ciconiae]